MRKYNKHRVMMLDSACHLDPILVMACHRLMVWANEQGLRGNQVKDLQFTQPEVIDMLRQKIHVTCWVQEDADERQ